MDRFSYLAHQQRNSQKQRIQPKLFQVIVCGQVVYEKEDIRLVQHYIKQNALKVKPKPIY